MMRDSSSVQIAIAVFLIATLATTPSTPSARADETSQPALAVIVHPSVTDGSLSIVEISRLFSGRRQQWSRSLRAVPFNYAPEDDLRKVFDRAVLGMSPEQVGRYWRDQRIRHGTRPPRQLAGPTLTVRVIGRLIGSIGYVPANLVTDDVRVVAWIRDGKLTLAKEEK